MIFYSENICEILYNKITKENVDLVFCDYKLVFDMENSKD